MLELAPYEASRIYSAFVRDQNSVSDWELAQAAVYFMELAAHLHALTTSGVHYPTDGAYVLLPRPEDLFATASSEASRAYRKMLEVGMKRGVIEMTLSGGFQPVLSANAECDRKFTTRIEPVK